MSTDADLPKIVESSAFRESEHLSVESLTVLSVGMELHVYLFVQQNELGNALPPRQRWIDTDSPNAFNDVAVRVSSSGDFVPDESVRELPVEVNSVVPVKPTL